MLIVFKISAFDITSRDGHETKPLDDENERDGDGSGDDDKDSAASNKDYESQPEDVGGDAVDPRESFDKRSEFVVDDHLQAGFGTFCTKSL